MTSGFRLAALAACCASLGACATVTRGPNTAWEVRTSPVGAAVRTSDGLACDSTPCSLRVSRRAHFTATISKPGYRPLDVKVSHGISTAGGVAFAGNVLVGGLLGAGLDLATGAMNDVTPNGLDLALEPDGSRPVFGDADYLAAKGVPAFTYTGVEPRAAESRAAEFRSGALAAGRVLDLKLLSNGAVEETRAAPF